MLNINRNAVVPKTDSDILKKIGWQLKPIRKHIHIAPDGNRKYQRSCISLLLPELDIRIEKND